MLIAQPTAEPGRRDARQRLVSLTQLSAYEIESELGDKATAQVDVCVRFDALKQTIGRDGRDDGESFRIDVWKEFGEFPRSRDRGRCSH